MAKKNTGNTAKSSSSSSALAKRVSNLEKAVKLLVQGVNTEEQSQAVKAALGGK